MTWRSCLWARLAPPSGRSTCDWPSDTSHDAMSPLAASAQWRSSPPWRHRDTRWPTQWRNWAIRHPASANGRRRRHRKCCTPSAPPAGVSGVWTAGGWSQRKLKCSHARGWGLASTMANYDVCSGHHQTGCRVFTYTQNEGRGRSTFLLEYCDKSTVHSARSVFISNGVWLGLRYVKDSKVVMV